MMGTMRDGHTAQHLLYALLALLLGNAKISEWQFHILLHVQFIDEVEALEHEADMPFANLGALAFLQAAHVLAIEKVGSAGGIVEQSQNVEQRRFTTTRRPHDGHELPFLHFERHAAQCYGLHLFRAEHFLNVFKFNHILFI